MFKDISKDEWKFLGIIWVIVVFIVFLPIIVGYFMTPKGGVFLFRLPMVIDDYTVYFSNIEQSKSGVLFLRNLFTSEFQTTGVLYIFWTAVGFLAKFFSLSAPLAFYASSFLLIPVFLIYTFYFISHFFNEVNKRKICFVFFIFASGLGGLISYIVNKNLPFQSMYGVEASSINILSSPPHYIASYILMVLVFLLSLFAFEKNSLRYSLLTGLCAFFLFSFHPYHIYVVFGVLFAFLATEFLIERKIYVKHIIHSIILLIFSAPPIIYYLWVFLNIPIRHATFSQNINLTPAIWIVLVDYSCLLILAILGIRSLLKKVNIDKRQIFLIVWAVVQFFLLFLPINTQEQLLEGFNLPIIILAFYGLVFLNNLVKEKLKPAHFIRRGILLAAFISIFCFSNIIVFSNNFNFFRNYPMFAYIQKDEKDAMVWIKENTHEQDAILSSDTTGNIIPAIAVRPVYWGHWGETVNLIKKEEAFANFLKNTDSQGKKDFLNSNNINYLFWGPEEEKTFNGFDPNKEDFLRKVYSNNTVKVYRVN